MVEQRRAYQNEGTFPCKASKLTTLDVGTAIEVTPYREVLQGRRGLGQKVANTRQLIKVHKAQFDILECASAISQREPPLDRLYTAEPADVQDF